MFEEYGEFGVVGLAMALAYAAIQLVLKKFGNGRPVEVDLSDNIKKAIYDGQAAAIATAQTLNIVSDIKPRVQRTEKWHEPDQSGNQDWRGGRILEAQHETNELLKEIREGIHDIVTALKKDLIE